jgi:hypothetical protein
MEPGSWASSATSWDSINVEIYLNLASSMDVLKIPQDTITPQWSQKQRFRSEEYRCSNEEALVTKCECPF